MKISMWPSHGFFFFNYTEEWILDLRGGRGDGSWCVSIVRSEDMFDVWWFNFWIGTNRNLLQKLFESRETDTFYLTGDEMFLIKMLDSKNELSPKSEIGWNFYRACNRAHNKSIVDSGLHTSITILILWKCNYKYIIKYWWKKEWCDESVMVET